METNGVFQHHLRLLSSPGVLLAWKGVVAGPWKGY